MWMITCFVYLSFVQSCGLLSLVFPAQIPRFHRPRNPISGKRTPYSLLLQQTQPVRSTCTTTCIHDYICIHVQNLHRHLNTCAGLAYMYMLHQYACTFPYTNASVLTDAQINIQCHVSHLQRRWRNLLRPTFVCPEYEQSVGLDDRQLSDDDTAVQQHTRQTTLYNNKQTISISQSHYIE